jgi:E3 ubiquitin-protein ligase synoviolin
METPPPESSNGAHDSLPTVDLTREPSILELEQTGQRHAEGETSDKGKGRAVTMEEAEDEET